MTPRLVHDPKAKPLGYIPPEGHELEPAAPASNPPAGADPGAAANPDADPK